MGVHKEGAKDELGSCSFNGLGEATNPVVKKADSKQTPPAPAKVVKEEKVVVLTKGELKTAIELKCKDNGIEYTPELHKAIGKLNRDPLEAYLNDDANFKSETAKEADDEAAKAKADADAKSKEKKPEDKKETKEEKEAREKSQAEDKEKLIAEITKLQVDTKEEKPMSIEELNEMSPEALADYKGDLSS